MKSYIKIIFIVSLCLTYISCNRQQREIRNIVKTWSGKKIVFPPLSAKILGRDTIIPDISNHKYKVLTYIDTMGCTACRLKLYDWKLLIKEWEELSKDVAVIFVVHSNNYEEFETEQKVNKFTYPVFYDYDAALNRLNHFPQIPDFQTFLLDQDDKVLLIGNPLTNDALRQLYKKTLEE